MGCNSSTDIVPTFFFGRKATNNTVVASKASAENALANHILLPSHFSTNSALHKQYSIETELFALNETAGYVYCFGILIPNYGSAVTAEFDISLAIRKYSEPLSVFPADGS